MIRTPAHKQTNPAKAPGQIKTLGEYIDQKTAHEPKKLTFDEWWDSATAGFYGYNNTHYNLAKLAWQSGRENM